MPIRILHVAGGLPRWGGTERYVLDVSTAQAERGYSVTLACPAGSVLADRADSLGLPRIAFEMRSTYDFTYLPRLMRSLAGRFDVVHTHSPLDYTLPAVAARLCGVSVIVMTRHLPHPFASPRTAFFCSPILYDRIIAVSCFIRDVLIRSGARPERIEVVHNGIVPVKRTIDAGRCLREELGIPRNAILIAAAGRMTAEKGFDVLIRAVWQLRCSGTEVYCAIFGAGKLLDSLRSLARELHVDSHLRLPGFRDDVDALWSTADIAVIPSVWKEPFGFVAVEALSAGCALIASRIGALPEILSCDSALFTEPGDVAGIAAAVRDLASSPHLLKQMQRAALHRAKLFTLESCVTGLERIYSDVSISKESL